MIVVNLFNISDLKLFRNKYCVITDNDVMFQVLTVWDHKTFQLNWKK